MELTLYQVDAFTDRHFERNPAAVIPLETWLPDDVMQSIAEEKQLTDFFEKRGHSTLYICYTDKVGEQSIPSVTGFASKQMSRVYVMPDVDLKPPVLDTSLSRA